MSAGLASALSGGVVLLLGLAVLTPGTLAAYGRAAPVFDLHPDRDARRAGIAHGVVVIPDGWGSRIIARMEALGVRPPRAMRLYAAIDACALEQALDAAALDRTGAARSHLGGTLDSLAALRRPGIRTDATQDPNLRLPADGVLAPACRAELAFDARGFIEFTPFLYLNHPSLDGDVVWARDLGPWNADLFARYPGRGLYRYAPEAPGRAPHFVPLTGPGDVDEPR